MTIMRSVLDGVKVLDFTWAAAGPITVNYLATHGATVVRVESRSTPCIFRASPPFKGGTSRPDMSTYFAYYNANKYSIILNLASPRGKEVAKRLVAWADIITEGFTPGVMERLGLGYDDLTKIKPDIIMFRCCNQGQTGGHAKQPGYGTQLVGLAGFTHLTGWPDRGPSQPHSSYTDFIAPRFGAAALIAALNYRRKTGKGQCLDLSQYEAGVHFLAPLIIDKVINGREANRMGNSCSYAAPHGVYRCQGEDRWCAIAVFTDEEWRAFCNVIGNPEWTREPKYSTLRGRKENETELEGLVEQWTIAHSAEEVMNLMQKARVPAGVVQNNRDVCQDPQLKERGYFWKLPHREMGQSLHIGQSFKMSETPAELKMPGPCLGEHTEYVCRELLGMPDEEFVQLVNTGAFE